MNTLTLEILNKALDRVRHGFPSFDGAIRYMTNAPEDVWWEVDELLFTARLDHDGGPDDVPPLPYNPPGTPRRERYEVARCFFRWREALLDAHACVLRGLPWEDAEGGGGLTRPQAVTVLCFAILLAQQGAQGLDVAPGEVVARTARRARYLEANRPRQKEPALLGDMASRQQR